MSRAPIDLYAEELQRAEPADPDVLAWIEIAQGFRHLAVFAVGVLIGLVASSILGGG